MTGAMTKPASTVDETEDADLKTAVATADADQDDTPKVDDLATDKPEPKAEPEKGEQPEKPVADKAKATPAAKNADSPIQKAIDHLAIDGPEKLDKPKAAEKPASKAPATPAPEKSGTDATPAKPTVDELFGDWTQEERKHTKGTVKQRFRDMSTKIQQYEKQLKDAPDPDVVEIGKSWDQLLEKHDLDADVNTLSQEQVAWTIKSQAAVVRTMQAVARGQAPAAADLKILDTVRSGLNEVDRHLGREAAKADSEIDLDKLEQLVKQAGETLDLDAIQAFLTEAKAKKGAKAAPPAAPVKQPTAADPAPMHQPVPRTEIDADRELYANRFRAAVGKHGVKPDKLVPWFNANVLPRLDKVLRRDFPGQKPEVVYPRLSPSAKHELHMESLKEWESEQKSAPPITRQQTQPGTRPLRTAGSSAGNSQAESPIAAAISRLASDR